MPLLEIVQTTHVNATIRLKESTAALVDQYAAFLHAPGDEVVDKALAYVFSKDRDFQDFLRTPKPLIFNRRFVSVVSVKTVCLPGLRTVAGSQPNKPRPSMSRACAASMAAVSIAFGAAHRVYFDTPSLKGSCGESVRIHTDGVTEAVIYGRGGFIRILANPYESTL
jgi:hypothetical protein